MRGPAQRFVILDLTPGEFCIKFRDAAHFKNVVRDLALKKYRFMETDDDGKIHPIKTPKI